MGDVAPDVDPADTVFSVLFILPSACPATSSRAPCGLQEGRVWAPGSFIDQDVQGLLKDAGLWEFHLQKASNPQLLPSGPHTIIPLAQFLLHWPTFTDSLAWTVFSAASLLQRPSSELSTARFLGIFFHLINIY